MVKGTYTYADGSKYINNIFLMDQINTLRRW